MVSERPGEIGGIEDGDDGGRRAAADRDSDCAVDGDGRGRGDEDEDEDEDEAVMRWAGRGFVKHHGGQQLQLQPQAAARPQPGPRPSQGRPLLSNSPRQPASDSLTLAQQLSAPFHRHFSHLHHHPVHKTSSSPLSSAARLLIATLSSPSVLAPAPPRPYPILHRDFACLASASSSSRRSLPCNGFLVLQRRGRPLPCRQEDWRGFLWCHLRGHQPAQSTAGRHQVCMSAALLYHLLCHGSPECLSRFLPTACLPNTNGTVHRNLGNPTRLSFEMNTERTRFS